MQVQDIETCDEEFKAAAQKAQLDIDNATHAKQRRFTNDFFSCTADFKEIELSEEGLMRLLLKKSLLTLSG